MNGYHVTRSYADGTTTDAALDSALSAGELVRRILKGAPRIVGVSVAPSAHDPVRVGDTVSVEEGRFRGCILDVVAVESATFLCRNDTYGTYIRPGLNVRVISTKAVSLYRRRPTLVQVG